MKPYISKSLTLFLLLFLLQSCSDEPGVWRDKKIDAGKRSDFHALNEEALGYLKINGYKRLKLMMSKEMNSDKYTEQLVEHISNHLNDNKYSLFNEFYIINRHKSIDTVKSTGADINRYSLRYPGTTQYMYMAFFLPKNTDNKYMISLIYYKYDYGWKISKMDVEPYTINGKTGPELFQMAKEAYSNNYLIEAVNTSALANTCFKPVDIWQYPDEDSLQTFCGKVIQEANNKYTFPFTLNGIPTKPRVIRIYNQTDNRGSFPVVHYLSTINIKDTVSIKNENMQVRKMISHIMPGLNKNKKYVFYSAFNEMPSSLKEVDRFEMTDKLN
jgi:hypothetical protein